MRRIALFASISALVLGVLPLAPVHAAPAGNGDVIAGSYIVVLSDGQPGSVAAEHSRRHRASVRHVYTHALRGYAAAMSERAAANIARDPRVAYVEPDGVVTASATTQTSATWGLDRVDQRSLPLSGSYTYGPAGSGVTAYVIDSGIRRTHTDFTGRVSGEYFDAFSDGRNGEDCNGHGTHVAGTIGGTTWGIAKAVSLVPVRVLDCSGSGTWSGVIAGLDWVTAHHQASQPAVANMSLGGGASSSVDAAVQRAIDDGVTVVVAAGNGNNGGKEQDACGYSPARVPAAITIGATTKDDVKTSWSNYGSCVDWFAPGAGITSAWYDSDTATRTISGTSMAAPHVAGAAALHLEGAPGATPAQVTAALYEDTTKGIVTSSKTANNHLLFTDPPATTIVDDENTAPTAYAQSVTVAAGSSIDVTLTGTDAEQCELTFMTTPASAGTVDAPQPQACTDGTTPKSDTAVVKYTPTSGTTATSDSFTYTVSDGAGGTSAAATVSITITHAPPPDGEAATDSISATQYGGKHNTNHVDVAVSVTTASGGVSGAVVTVSITRDGGDFWSGTGTTSSSGVVFSFKNIPTGSYTATVTNVTPPEPLTWSGPGDSTAWSK